MHCRYKFQGNFLHFCVAESAFLCYNVFVKKIRVKPGKIKGFSPVLFWTRETEKNPVRKNRTFFNNIRSSSERVIYLRYDIHLRWMIYASHMKERILYHICRANISYGLPYIISHSDISFNLARSPLLCYNTPKAVLW